MQMISAASRLCRALLRPAALCLFALVLVGADPDEEKPKEKRRKEVKEAEEAAVKETRKISFAQPGSVIKGFSAPQFNADGQLMGRIHSERAIVQADGKYRVEGIHVQGFKEGRPDYLLTLDHCIYNQDTGLVTSDQVVRINRTNVAISGEGVVWDLANFHGRLLSNVVMVISDIEKGFKP